MRINRSRAHGIAVVLWLALTPAAAHAATINVNSQADVTNDDGQCTLREAVISANTNTASGASTGECAGGQPGISDTIEVPAGSYGRTLAAGGENNAATGDLDLISDMTIHGAGATTTTIDAGGKDRVFDISGGATVRIEGVTITGGAAGDGAAGGSQFSTGGAGGPGNDGGGIRNSATLTLVASTVTANRAGNGGAGGAGDSSILGNGSAGQGGAGGAGGAGGGIYNTGTLTVERSSFTSNVAGTGGAGGLGRGSEGMSSGGGGHGGAGGTGGGGGGMAGSGGSATFTDSTIAGNRSGPGGAGGTGTGARGPDGASGAGGPGGSGIGGNGGEGGAGAGLSPDGPLTLSRSTLSGNIAGRGGGGGNGQGGGGGSADATQLSAGGAAGSGTGGGGGAGGSGGGLFHFGTVMALNVTVTGNHGGDGASGGAGIGGMGGNGGNVNPGGSGGNGGNGAGGAGGAAGDGAGFFTNGLQLTHATFFANTVGNTGPGAFGTAGRAGSSGPGAPGSGADGTKSDGDPGQPATHGGIHSLGTATITSSILAGNVPFNCGTAGGGSFADGGFDLDFPGSACPGLDSDPGFGTFGDNGGPTATLPIAPSSPAVDLVPVGDACAPTDQRGLPRPAGAACDAGAYEVTPPVATTGAAQGETMTGTVTPNLRSTQYHFEYGTTTAYGSSTPDGDAGTGGAAVPVSAPATGLTPATTYHYRLVATSADGTAAGADMTFTTANPLPLDTVAPVFSGVSVTNKVFKVGPAGTAVSARKRRTKVGTTFRFTLSETATVKIAIQRAAQGRRKGKRCVKPTRKLHRAKKCTRFTAAGTLTRSGQAGANTVPFSGRIGRKKLGPGTYRARLIATDAAGNRSLTKTLKFKIVRR